ncbi:hypothetical protein G5I_07449 [Acromyrmex echinatior]|uniref:Uncharacterized protein n=1 Tax=Acromyrmex echinatior TaxID=103372 RepID=F4WNU2_ACREC|nr:hypothetical protein G5I_07449 [Acromyrmex echinatior]
MRRYVLTLTAYKFLDIEIVIGSQIIDVEIAISDNRGNRIILPHATWKASIERRADIERLMQSTVSSSSSSIQDVNVELKVFDSREHSAEAKKTPSLYYCRGPTGLKDRRLRKLDKGRARSTPGIMSVRGKAASKSAAENAPRGRVHSVSGIPPMQQ